MNKYIYVIHYLINQFCNDGLCPTTFIDMVSKSRL